MYEMMQKAIVACWESVGALLLIVAAVIMRALPVMLLWDWLMPGIFGLRAISLFEAWGIGFLSTVLFRSSPASKTVERWFQRWTN